MFSSEGGIDPDPESLRLISGTLASPHGHGGRPAPAEIADLLVLFHLPFVVRGQGFRRATVSM